jgi:hypothetical protein
MIDSARLLADLTRLLAVLERDLQQQLEERPDVRALLEADYNAARAVGRTRDTFETWCEEPITQAAVAWLLGTVFARFLEDNELVDPMLSGTGARHKRAAQEHQHYFLQHPLHTEREYLLYLFERLAAFPATAALFDQAHNPLWRLPLSADGARTLVEFWQHVDPDTGSVAQDFTDPALDTRFLGDLYQDLSEPVRKRYALLQTPRFVESFILDRTLTPAVETFGYREVRLIDPTCGSGHFLLGAFDRLLRLAQEHEPTKDVRPLVQHVLSRVVGVDVNPYAVAIAHFRLTIAALAACGTTRLTDAPGFSVSVVAADSLLHGPRFSDDGSIQMSVLPDDPANQYYFAEDEVRVHRLLGRQYHVVVGNPPYITVRDPALNALYRQRYGACHRQFSLVVPFLERFFDLGLSADSNNPGQASFVGLIVANSFMKREFGKVLITEYIPRWDLTHVIDTSGAYIPGHGTPTVILFGRHRRPESDTVRAVMGIRGEPSTPHDAACGLVWSAILEQIDQAGSQGVYVSADDLARVVLSHHPWSLAGGGASDLKEHLEERAGRRLRDVIEMPIGRAARIGADEAFTYPPHALRRLAPAVQRRPLLVGDAVRDWRVSALDDVIFPYTADLTRVHGQDQRHIERFLWPLRALLEARATFQGDMAAAGLNWFEYMQYTPSANTRPMSIAFAFVATHNHFTLDRGGKVFNRSAPVIKLGEGSTENDHLALLGLLNSSTACFWMKQVFYPKGGDYVGNEGARVRRTQWDERYEFTGGGLEDFPVIKDDELTRLARRLHESAESLALNARADNWVQASGATLKRMIGLQEELDWAAYAGYGLLSIRLNTTEPPLLDKGQRAFEIVMARQMLAGGLETTWFERHGSTPITEIPTHWPEDYRRLVERRIDLIQSDRSIRLIEQPEYKRRWNIETFEEQLKRHLRGCLCDRLEAPKYWSELTITSSSKLADQAKQDPEFVRIAEQYAGDAIDVGVMVDELVRDDSVPFLAVLRYRDSGLAKRAQWDRTWDLQRREDSGESVGDIPVPPRYTSDDFMDGVFWRHRGKLDVPKERFISYPGCERAADGSLPIAWAGWDHAQQARALGAYYMRIKDEEGTVPQKLVPLLAGLLELIPWIRQWHPGPDPEFGDELGDIYANFVDVEARALGLTQDDIRGWRPEPTRRARRARPARARADVADTAS